MGGSHFCYFFLNFPPLIEAEIKKMFPGENSPEGSQAIPHHWSDEVPRKLASLPHAPSKNLLCI